MDEHDQRTSSRESSADSSVEGSVESSAEGSAGGSAGGSGTWAVVVNWNGGLEQNLACLRSLEAQGLQAGRIVFVDNASSDGSREEVAAAMAGLVHLDNGDNLGFGEAANQGAKLALDKGAEAVFFVNNDLRFDAGASCLAELEETLSSGPRVGMAGPRILFDDDTGRVWCAGGRLDFRQNLSTLLGHKQPDGPRWRESGPVDYIPGCALLVSRECLQDVGFFDAAFFAYMEDVDLGLRARRRNWSVLLRGDLRALHAPSSSTGGGYGARRKWMQGVNSIRFLVLHGRPTHWLRFLVFDVLTLPGALLLRGCRGEGAGVLAKAKGILDGARGRRVTAEALEPGASRLWP